MLFRSAKNVARWSPELFVWCGSVIGLMGYVTKEGPFGIGDRSGREKDDPLDQLFIKR